MRRFHHNIYLFAIGCTLLGSEIAVAQFPVHVGDHGFRQGRQLPATVAYQPQTPSAASGRQPQQQYAAFPLSVPLQTNAPQPMYAPPQASSIAFPGGSFDSNPAALPFAAPRRRPVTTPVLGSRTRRPTAAIPFPTAAPLQGSLSDLSTYAVIMPNTTSNPYWVNPGIPPTAFQYTQNANAAISMPSYHPPVTLNATSPAQHPNSNFGMTRPPAMPQAGFVPPAYTRASFPTPVNPLTAFQQNTAPSSTANAPIHVYPPNVRLRN